jgi:hypothetical protein
VPCNVGHYLIWSRVPFLNVASIDARPLELYQTLGLWGFTGIMSEPPSHISDADRRAMRGASEHLHTFIVERFPEDEWETAWIVNPPVCHKYSYTSEN